MEKLNKAEQKFLDKLFKNNPNIVKFNNGEVSLDLDVLKKMQLECINFEHKQRYDKNDKWVRQHYGDEYVDNMNVLIKQENKLNVTMLKIQQAIQTKK